MKLEAAYNNVLAKTNNGTVCPAHEDDHGSLSVNQVEDRILIKCHAGCEFKNIVAALGMRSDDFFEKQQKRKNANTAGIFSGANHGRSIASNAGAAVQKKMKKYRKTAKLERNFLQIVSRHS